MIVKMIQDIRNKMDKLQEKFTDDLEELKNKWTEMNSALKGINVSTTDAEEWISDMAAEWWKSLLPNGL